MFAFVFHCSGRIRYLNLENTLAILYVRVHHMNPVSRLVLGGLFNAHMKITGSRDHLGTTHRWGIIDSPNSLMSQFPEDMLSQEWCVGGGGLCN